jgi:hypothetical protein
MDVESPRLRQVLQLSLRAAQCCTVRFKLETGPAVTSLIAADKSIRLLNSVERVAATSSKTVALQASAVGSIIHS